MTLRLYSMARIFILLVMTLTGVLAGATLSSIGSAAATLHGSQASMRSETSCPAAGTWAGSPYLNRFWTGTTDSNGTCTYNIQPLTIPSSSGATQVPASITVPAGTTAYVENTVTVAAGGTLAVASGATVKFSPFNSISHTIVAVYVDSGGTFTVGDADSSASNLATLTSAASSPAPGDWGGVDYQPGSRGSIRYATINFAGADMSNSSGCNNVDYYCTFAGILIEGPNPTISITHSNFDNINYDSQDSLAHANGIEVSGGAPLLSNDAFRYCTTCFKDSSNNPLLSSGSAVQFDDMPGDLTTMGSPLLNGLSSSGYLYNDVVIPAGTYTATGIWPNPGIPYLLVSNFPTIAAGGSLTIGAGATIEMAVSANYVYNCGAFYVESGGVLNLSGTSSAPITLTSPNPNNCSHNGSPTAPAPGDWGGIDYQPGSSGTISYTTIDNAGGTMGNSSGCSPRFGNACTLAGILVEGVSPKITHTTIENSGGNDVEVSGGGLPTLRDDSFGLVLSGHYGVANDGGPTIDATYNDWGDPTGPYDPVGNPNGKGSPVTTGVSYNPWLNGSYMPMMLANGWNALGLPTEYYSSASVLVRDIQAQCPGVTVTAVASYANGRFRMYVPGYTPDLAFSQAQGVMALLAGGTTISWSPVDTPITAAQPIPLAAGWSLVSFPVPASLKASTICNEINSTTQSQNLGCSDVAMYTSAGWRIYVASTGNGDFTALPDQSVMILDIRSGTWTPK